MKLPFIAALGVLALSAPALAQTSSLHAGEQLRRIKSLSESDMAGQGAGYAKEAELNGYPGPMHTLELSSQLALSAAQTAASQALRTAHKARARDLGVLLVDAEARLDALFAGRSATAQSVQQAAAEVGALQARLRAEHLNTHLLQTALPNSEQVRRYGELRGYSVSDVVSPQPAARPHKPHH